MGASPRAGTGAGPVSSALRAAGLVACALLSACVAPAAPALPDREPTTMELALRGHVEVLASDEFAGREVGTIGEELTLSYLQEQFAQMGLKSGTHDPTHPWREPVSYEEKGGQIDTYNLIARLPGTEPQAGAVLLVAHWDHLGYGSRCRRKGDDTICNGAVDNASGLAVMLEVARALASGPRPRRDVYFLATGGEEDGLRGAASFVNDPPVPLEKFVAAFNLDTEGIAPPGAPVVVLATPGPPTMPELMALIEQTAAEQGVTIVAPSRRNLRFLKRQDGWVFDEVGIPAVMISAAFAQEARLDAFMSRRYHRANDEADGVELGAAADMVRYHTQLLRKAGDPALFPLGGGSAARSYQLTAIGH